MKPGDKLDEQLESVELLGEPVRRALYLHVARQPAEVSRDEAAAAVKVSRELAALRKFTAGENASQSRQAAG